MPLRPLVLSAELGAEVDCPVGEAVYAAAQCNNLYCAFCGLPEGRWQRFGAAACPSHDPVAICPLCFLCGHLERPRIDAEASLVWLPETTQAALNVTMREIHIALSALGDDLRDTGGLRLDTPERSKLNHARAAFSGRIAAAASRLGTDKPSELAAALYRLAPGAYANRAKLLGGVRLLPLGRFYDGGRDVYPEIVDGWRALAKPDSSRASSRSTPLSGL